MGNRQWATYINEGPFTLCFTMKPLFMTIYISRLKLAGHIHRHPEEAANKLLM